MKVNEAIAKANKLYLYGQLTDKEYAEIMSMLQPQEDVSAESAEV